MATKKKDKIRILINVKSELKRKVAIETFVANGYTKKPTRSCYTDNGWNYIILENKKVIIRIQWVA